MDYLYQSAFAAALGWSLIDSLWQMGAAWIFYTLITGNGSRFSSQIRHNLALAAVTTGTLLFIFSLIVNYYGVNNNNFFSLTYYLRKHLEAPFVSHAVADKVVPFISLLYVPLVLFFSLRLLLQFSLEQKIYHTPLVNTDSKIARFVNDMSERLGIIINIAVRISRKVASPLTVGYWKPVIVLPIAIFSYLSCSQVEAVIMHELHHIKRNDYIINIFLSIAEIVFFFNPFALMMFATVKKEREHSCDDHVIASGFDAWEYSQALYLLGRYKDENNNLAIAATGEGKEYLLQRIRRIMKRKNPPVSVVKPLIAFFLCLFVAGASIRVEQTPGPPDVVSHYMNTSMNNTAPAAYYSAEKVMTVKKATKAIVPSTKKKDFVAIKKIEKTKIILPALPKIPKDDFDRVIVDYVAAPRVIEFTIIDHLPPVVPIVSGAPHPYIQKSSFYFTEIDTTAGQKVVNL